MTSDSIELIAMWLFVRRFRSLGLDSLSDRCLSRTRASFLHNSMNHQIDEVSQREQQSYEQRLNRQSESFFFRIDWFSLRRSANSTKETLRTSKLSSADFRWAKTRDSIWEFRRFHPEKFVGCRRDRFRSLIKVLLECRPKSRANLRRHNSLCSKVRRTSFHCRLIFRRGQRHFHRSSHELERFSTSRKSKVWKSDWFVRERRSIEHEENLMWELRFSRCSGSRRVLNLAALGFVMTAKIVWLNRWSAKESKPWSIVTNRNLIRRRTKSTSSFLCDREMIRQIKSTFVCFSNLRDGFRATDRRDAWRNLFCRREDDRWDKRDHLSLSEKVRSCSRT